MRAAGRRGAVLLLAGLTGLALAGCAGSGGSVAAGHPSARSSLYDAGRRDAAASSAPTSGTALERCPDTSASAKRSGGGRNALPDVRLPCLGAGPAVSMARLTGTPTLVNVWSENCAPCRDELPLLQGLHRRAAGKVLVLGADQGPSTGAARALLADVGATYPSVRDADAALRPVTLVAGWPVTLFLDARGTVVHRKTGAFRSRAELDDAVHRYLGVDL